MDDELNLQDINSHELITGQTFPKAENKCCTHGLYSPPDAHTCRMFVFWTKPKALLILEKQTQAQQRKAFLKRRDRELRRQHVTYV